MQFAGRTLRVLKHAAVRSFRESPTVRLVSVGLLVLLLQIPIAMIGSLVGERQARRDAAITDVSGKWGGSQTIVGPALGLDGLPSWLFNELRTASSVRLLMADPGIPNILARIGGTPARRAAVRAALASFALTEGNP